MPYHAGWLMRLYPFDDSDAAAETLLSSNNTGNFSFSDFCWLMIAAAEGKSIEDEGIILSLKPQHNRGFLFQSHYDFYSLQIGAQAYARSSSRSRRRFEGFLSIILLILLLLSQSWPLSFPPRSPE